MTTRRRKYEEEPGTAILLERERMHMGRYRKAAVRDPDKRRLLIELALERIREVERVDFLPIGFRRRRIRM